MTGIFTGKAAIVTGGGSGIGRAIAERLGARGAGVLVADIREESAGEVSAGIRARGGRASAVAGDVSRAKDVEGIVGRCVEDFGRLDLAFNCAGISGSVTPVVALEEDDWDRVIDVNLKGTWLSMKYELAAMEGPGAVVNVASIGSQVALPGLGAYCASKGGVAQLTRAAALESIGRGVRVNAICPGVTDTPLIGQLASDGGPSAEGFAAMIPAGRLADPGEIADAALWLASEEASYVVGHLFFVDGGFTVQ